MKQIIKKLTPPIVIDIYRYCKTNKYGWHGDYATWEEALGQTSGYDSNIIINQVRETMLKVRDKKIVSERDSVAFDEIQYSWPMLAGLMYAFAKTSCISGGGGSLKVCDFGGSLGSTYYQNKKFLDGIEKVSWNIIEQKHFVDIGKKEFENDRLRFYYDVASCQKEQNTDILLLSGVLQYIKEPDKLLKSLLKYEFRYIIIDRTPFATKSNKKQIKIQNVPPSIYEASYPCWFFNESEFLSWIENNGYGVVEKFQSDIDGKGADYETLGFICEKI